MSGCALAAILASNVAGALSIDVRALTGIGGDLDSDNFLPITPQGGASGFAAMEVWAVVTNGNGNVRDDGLCKFYSSFLSTSGGLILGNLMSDFPAGNMWGEGPKAHKGEPYDLDGDTDADIGSNVINADAPPMFLAQASNDNEFYSSRPVPTVHPLWEMGIGNSPADVEAWKVEHDTNEWHVATLYFVALPDWNEPIDPATGRPGVVEIWARPRQIQFAGWKEDGELKVNYVDPATEDYGVLETGDKTLLGVPSEAHGPEGGPFEVGPGGPPLLLNGSASTGSINWWGWDFDGDGDYEIEGLGEDGNDAITVTYAELVAMGVLDGHYPNAKMTVGWSASDPRNTDTTTFDLTIVPEPATVALLAVGLVTLIRRRK